MLASEVEVSDLLERVMSRVPTAAEKIAEAESARAAQFSETAIQNDPKWQLQGILAETRVTTNFGKVPAQLVRRGDRVRTRSGRYLPVRDIQVYKLDLEFVERHPEALPVAIKQGAIDGKYPTQDVLLSPEQLITVDGQHARPKFIPACDVPRSQRSFDPALGVVAYYKFILDEPVELYCEGIWVRSAAPAVE